MIRFVVTGFCLLVPSFAVAQVSEAVRLLDVGNQQYLEGAYHEALITYQEALDEGYTSGALYYNMGNVYYRLDQRGQALRYYEKAQRFLAEDPHLLHNLQIVRSHIETPFSMLPPPFWEVGWEKYVAQRGATIFFVLGAVLYGIAAWFLALRIWGRSRNRLWHRRVLATVAAGSLLLLLVAFGVSLGDSADRRAVVIGGEVVLRSADGEEATEGIAVPEGIMLDILGHEEDRVEVRLPNGVRGTVPQQAVGEI